MQKDYYKTLGVMQDAEDIIIKAAYKALAQRYHPDKWIDNPALAAKRMSEINRAYETLSSLEKREQYDRIRTANEYDEFDAAFKNREGEDDLEKSLNENWQEAVRYFHDLETICRDLSKISPRLAQTYKIKLLKKKNFSERKRMAEEIEKTFIVKYFGDNEEIIKFAKFLIIKGEKMPLKILIEQLTCWERMLIQN